MTADIVVPTLGESVTEATVAHWLKKVGDEVAVDDPLVELETDKATLEVNATEAGTLAEILAEEGADVEVGALLGRIGEAGGGAAKQKQTDEGATKRAQETEVPAEPKQKEAAGAGAKGGDGATANVVVPTLGESVTEATVARWLKQAGDPIEADEALVELETDKVTLEVNAPAAGVLSDVSAQEGATVEVGALLGRIAPGDGAGTQVPQRKEAEDKAEEPKPKPVAAAPQAEQPGAALDPNKAPRSGPDKRITKSDLLAFLRQMEPGQEARPLSPAVRKMLEDSELDPARIRGTGKDGRITKGDVIDVLEGKSELRPAPVPAPPAAREPGGPAPEPRPSEEARENRVKMTRLRRRIAERLKEAQNTAAMLTTFNEADMGAVIALRREYREAFEKKHAVRLGFMSFFVKACVAALKELPAVNAQIEGEELIYKNYYDIGIAVSAPQGLVVPVLRDADHMSFADIEKTITELGQKARDGKLGMEEMSGGTFTITNGGIFGSLMSTPILNAPQSGILGMHKIQERPMVVDGEIKVRPMMYLALSYDHRIIDGREAVTFLVRVKECIEDPHRMLIEL